MVSEPLMNSLLCKRRIMGYVGARLGGGRFYILFTGRI